MTTFDRATTFEVYTCCHEGCGLQFGLTELFVKYRRKDSKFWYCPNGHSQHFTGETAEQRKLREAEAAWKAEQRRADNAERKADQSQRRAVAVNRQYKRIRDRVKNGVCPCCNRTFGNLASHMKTQHAEFGRHDLLKTLREAYGMTQTALAEEAWVKPHYISLFERGKPVPDNVASKIETWLTAQTA